MVAGLASYLVDRHSFYDRLKMQYISKLKGNEADTEDFNTSESKQPH